MPDSCRRCKAQLPEGAKYCPACGIRQEIVKGRRQRGNGTGTAYKRGKTWTAVYIPAWKTMTDEAGKTTLMPVKRTKGGFATKREALEYIPTLRGQKPKRAVTLAALYSSWDEVASPKLSKSKQTAYKIAYGKLTDILYRDITTLTIDDLQGVIQAKAPSFYTARDIKVLLSHLYKRALADQVVTVNLPQFIVLPALDAEEGEPFSEAELRALWADYGAGQTFTGYLLLMIYSGMMPGELIGCKKSMIDWERKEIRGCGLKTKERKKSPLVVADFMLPVLHDLCDYSTRGDSLLAVGRDAFYAEFKATLARCKCRALTPYSCRHTTATALALGNIAPSVIQKVMRHTKFTTTERYIHVDTAPMRDAINSLRETPIDNVLTTQDASAQ